MPQRNIIGPIVDAGGTGLPVGELHVTPIIPAGEAADGFVAKMRRYPITAGSVTAPVIVPGSYKLEVVSESGERLRAFTVDIPATSLIDITLKELWDSRSEVIDISPLTMHEGDNILRLIPGGGVAGQMLSQVGGSLVWRNPPRDGDMISSLYDPTRKQSNVYDRANHTGTQPISSIAGLSDELSGIGAGIDDLTLARGLVEYAIVCDRKAMTVQGGTFQNGADQLRTLNTVVLNNSGLASSALLDTTLSAVTLIPGRAYVGWAEAPAYQVGSHYLKLKSTDGSIIEIGAGQYSSTNASSATLSWARVEFRVFVAEEAQPKKIQVYHRAQFTVNNYGLGIQLRYPEDPGLQEEYTRLTIFSRPL